MQFRTLFAIVLFFLANVLVALAEEDTTTTTTVTTTIEVISTSWAVVTMTRPGPIGGLPNLVATGGNVTGAPTPTPTDSNSAGKSTSSLGLAAIVGAAAVLVSMW
ncbi:hypothetical protein DFH27DRAFT_610712 [Peziza echinospora]|nr:hypothetical protein DFH27DRAFT_610712 [Peziza echinospora]